MWEERWKSGRTGWDKGGSAPTLLELVESGTLPTGRALVPGCGAGYDVFALASPSRSVTGLDLAPTAVKRFEQLRAQSGVDAADARIVLGDFFTFPEEPKFDLIWDYTFLCALDPSQRPLWAKKVQALLAPGGELVTLLYPMVPRWPPSEEDWASGPPFPLHADVVRSLLEPVFEATVLEPVRQSHPSREGKEWLGRWRRKAA